MVPVVQAYTSDPSVGFLADYSHLDTDTLSDAAAPYWRTIAAWSSCQSTSGYTAEQPWELRAGQLTIALVDGPDPTVSPELWEGTRVRVALVPREVWASDQTVDRFTLWLGTVQRATTTVTKAGRRVATITAVDVVGPMQRGERVTRWVAQDATHGTASAMHHINALRQFIDPAAPRLPAALQADFGYLDVDPLADPANPLDRLIPRYWQQLTPAGHMDVLAASTGRRWIPTTDPTAPPSFQLMPDPNAPASSTVYAHPRPDEVDGDGYYSAGFYGYGIQSLMPAPVTFNALTVRVGAELVDVTLRLYEVSTSNGLNIATATPKLTRVIRAGQLPPRTNPTATTLELGQPVSVAAGTYLVAMFTTAAVGQLGIRFWSTNAAGDRPPFYIQTSPTANTYSSAGYRSTALGLIAHAVPGVYGDDSASRLLEVVQTLDSADVVNELTLTTYLGADSVDNAADQASTYTDEGSVAAVGVRHGSLTVALVDQADRDAAAAAAMVLEPALTVSSITVDDYLDNPHQLGDVVDVTRANYTGRHQIIGIDHDIATSPDYAGVTITTTYHLGEA